MHSISVEPAYHQHEAYQTRVKKLEEIRALGVEPYPHKFEPTHRVRPLLETHGDEAPGHSEDAAAGTTPLVCIAGRLMLFRAMGKNIFGQIQDETGRLQVMFNRDQTQVAGYDQENAEVAQPPSHLKFIEKKFDLGDILGIEGHLFHTNRGELTIFVKRVTLLTKTLLPLADKHGGLADKETRYRKRWLDLISNDEVMQAFQRRSTILRTVREHLYGEGFTEVETPVLQGIYGGAEARPFTTNLHSLDQDMFLRISLEIPLKKLIVGGMERVFELGRVFRNEGIDRTHNPEFTMLEAYAAYWDYNDMMRFVEELYEGIAMKLFGKTRIPYVREEGEEPVMIELKAPWPRLTMKGAIKKFANIDVDPLSEEEMRNLLRREERTSGKDIAAMTRGLLIQAIFEEFVEDQLVQPHHIIDHPIETTPLCKPHRDQAAREEGMVERFESFVLGNEMCNAYSELNDPLIQRRLLEAQAAKKEAGDEEASPLDEEFIEAICQGMPPCGGVGIGIDRLVMLFNNALSIRDVLLFPWMKEQQ